MTRAHLSRFASLFLGPLVIVALAGAGAQSLAQDVERPRAGAPAAKAPASQPSTAKPATDASKSPASKPVAKTAKPAAATGAAATTQTPATPARAAGAADVPKIAFEKYTLPNGMQVILHVDRKLPIVHVNQWYHVGSKNEQTGRTGFAHLFEHMMFQGSVNAADDYFKFVEQAGANLGEGGVNGTTDNDRTNYFATVPSANLENLLWLESDRLATLADATNKEKLDNQRDVVKNERRQSLENQPYGRWFSLVFAALYPAGHPYSWPVIGSQEDLTAASLDDVKEFFRRYYTPNNLSLVIAGDFDPAAAKALVAKYFGPIPPGPALDRPARWIPELTSEKVVEVHDRVAQERVYMAWTGPEYFGADEAELNLAARILADGLSSRLTKALVYDRQLCTAVNAFTLSSEIAGGFVVQATARPGTSLPAIEAVVTEQIAALAKTGPTAAELERVKTKQEFDFIKGLESIGGFGGKADVLNQYNTYLGDPGKFDEDLARHRRVTAESLRKAVDRWVNTRNRALVRFHPETSARPAQSTLDRTKKPALGADQPFHAPQVQTAKLENGLELFVVERKELPKVSVALATRAGAIADPADKLGVASMTVRAIDLGTTTRKALDIETAWGDLGTSLSGNTGRAMAVLSFEVLARNISPALGLLSDVAQHPTFPQSEVAREKTRQIDELTQQEKSPNQLASRVRAMLAFGADHPYGRPAQGLPRTVDAITRDDLVAFHRQNWKPGSSILVFVGNVSLAEATKLATQHFGGWSGGAAPAVTIPQPKPAQAGRIYLVDRQDSAQTVVSQLMPGPKRAVDDYYALQLADAVWGGGGFGTRLNLNLREDKGYSYGVFSTLSLYEQAGVWFASGGVQTNKTKESVVEFDKEMKALAGEKPISSDEFSTARLRHLRGYAQQFEGYGRVSQQIANLWALHLPMSELQREYDEVDKATLPSVLAATKKYAHPERSTLLLVGDRAKVEAGVRDLKLGDIVLLDVEGRPVSGADKTSQQP